MCQEPSLQDKDEKHRVEIYLDAALLSIFTMATDVDVHKVWHYADAVVNILLSSGESYFFYP